MDVTGAIPSMVVSDYGWKHNGHDNGNRIDHDTILRSLSDIRMEGKEAEATLLQAGAANAAVVAKQSADSLFRLHDNLRNVGDAILTSSNLTQAQIAAQGYATSIQFATAAVAAEKNTAAILAAMSATELRSVQDKLDEYRNRSHRYEQEISFGNRFSAFQSQLNDFAQEQRSTNQAINFGTGTIGAQSTTSNQVRS